MKYIVLLKRKCEYSKTMYVNAETDEEAKAFAGYLADKLDWTNMGAFFEKYEITNIQEFKNIV